MNSGPQLVKQFSSDGNWYRLVEPGEWRISRPGTYMEHYHFVPDERLEIRYEIGAAMGFAIWYDGARVEFIAETKELLYPSFVELARAKAIRWLARNRPAAL